MLYAILPRTDWDGRTPVAEHPGVMFVAAERLLSTVERLTLRSSLSYPSVRAYLRRNGSVYCASRRTAQYPGGVLVANVPRRKSPARSLDQSIPTA